MLNISPVNFRSKYQIDANQKMESSEACLKRDFAIGFWINNANNNSELQDKFKKFIDSDYKNDNKTPCKLTLELDDKYNNDFEVTMNMVGQKFNKLA